MPLKVQQQVPIHDGDQPPDRVIRFRVGINIGDAIADGTDLHGDAVNVVARLQAECPPGGICVSRSVRDHVHGRLDLVFEELGALNLKNIARPVEAFVLRLDAGLRCRVRSSRPSRTIRPVILPLPDKPSIAVLPFANLSGDPDQQYFADGLTEDILTALTHFSQLVVIARNSTFVIQGSRRQHCRYRTRPERALCPGRQRASVRGACACHRTVDRRGNISAPMG